MAKTTNGNDVPACWRDDPALLALQVARTSAEKELAALADEEPGRAQGLKHAEANLDRARALESVGGKADVGLHEKARADAERELRRVRGRRILLDEKLADLRRQLHEEREAAMRRSVERHRKLYAEAVKNLADMLLTVQQHAIRVEKIFQSANSDFPHASPEAKAAGTAAGMSIFSLAPLWLLPNDSRPYTGGADCWLAEARAVFQGHGLGEIGGRE